MRERSSTNASYHPGEDQASGVLEKEKGCTEVPHIVVVAQGAINILLAEIIEDHIQTHATDPRQEPDAARAKGAKELIGVVQSCLK